MCTRLKRCQERYHLDGLHNFQHCAARVTFDDITRVFNTPKVLLLLKVYMLILAPLMNLFLLRAAQRLSSKLVRQGYVMERLKSSLSKFDGRYGDLIKHYEVSLSQMLHDILGHDHIQ